MPRKKAQPIQPAPTQMGVGTNRPKIRILGATQPDETNLPHAPSDLDLLNGGNTESEETDSVTLEDGTLWVIPEEQKPEMIPMRMEDHLPEQPKKKRGRPKKNVEPENPSPHSADTIDLGEIDFENDEVSKLEKELQALTDSLEDDSQEEDYVRMQDLDYDDDPIDPNEDGGKEPEIDIEVVTERMREINQSIRQDSQTIRDLALQSKELIENWGEDYKELAREFQQMADIFENISA